MASEAFAGQTGKSIIRMFDANGQETDDWDKVGGVRYTSDDEAVGTIVDTDPDINPKDAQISAVGVGSTILRAEFDGKKGSEELLIQLQGVLDVHEPPPGGATSATFDFVWEEVPPA